MGNGHVRLRTKPSDPGQLEELESRTRQMQRVFHPTGFLDRLGLRAHVSTA